MPQKIFLIALFLKVSYIISCNSVTTESKEVQLVKPESIQIIPIPSSYLGLRKYSARLLLIKKGQPPRLGSCFFILKDACYMVTALHVMKGGNPGKKINWDTIRLYYTKRDNSTGILEMDAKAINNKLQGIDNEFSPNQDVFYFPISDQKLVSSINSVNDYTDSRYDMENPDSCIYFGTHFNGNEPNKINLKTDTVIGKYLALANYRAISLKNKNGSEYTAVEKRKLGFIMETLGTEGNSGSPVFGIYYDSIMQNQKFVWMGMAIMIAPQKRITYCNGNQVVFSKKMAN